jgi:hypothetical protein
VSPVTLERPLLALALALGALIVLYVLDRLRRRPVLLLVASLELFRKTAETESAAEATSKRAWRDLVLKGLASLALALAAGGPELAHGRSAGRRVRVLLDRSASMAAREPAGTRLDLARAELGRVLEALGDDDLVELHLEPPGEDEPSRALSRSEARAFVPRVLSVPSRVRERIDLFAAAASDKALPLLVVTDRELGPLPAELAPWVALARVGSPLENAGITALASRKDEHGAEQLLVATSSPATVELRMGSKVKRVPVAGSAIEPVPPGVDRVEARILRPGAGHDALSSDDVAIALRESDAPLRVAVDPALGAPLEAALRAVPGALVHAGVEATGNDVSFLPWRDNLDAPTGFQVYFAPADTDVVGPVTIDPALEPYRLADFIPKRVHAEHPLADTKSLVRDEKDHVLVGLGPRSAWIGFDAPREVRGTWAGDPSFAGFLAFLLERVRALVPLDLACHPTGEPLTLPRPPDAAPGARLVVTDPSNVAHPSGPRFIPLEAGVHSVRAEGGTKTVDFSAALLDPATEDLSGGLTRPFGPAVTAALAARSEARAGAPLAWLAALLALALAALAWSLDRR